MSMNSVMATLLILSGLAGCATPVPSSRNVTPTFLSTEGAGDPTLAPTLAMASPAALAIQGIEISVPQDLKVSEANLMVPNADIVWRGDPMGDRYSQVTAIFETAAASATQGLTEGRGVILSLEVTRFHALTEKARYLTGGNYALHFDLTLRDAASGVILDGPRPVVADVRAAGGLRAIAEDNAGRTEKVVITERLVEVLRYELSQLTLQPVL